MTPTPRRMRALRNFVFLTEGERQYRRAFAPDAAPDVRAGLSPELIRDLSAGALERLTVRRGFALSVLRLGQWGASMRMGSSE